MMTSLGETLKGSELERWQGVYEERIAAGVPEQLAAVTAGATNLYSSLGIIEASGQAERDLQQVAETYFEMGEYLSLNWFMQQINALPSSSHWDALARETLRDDLDWQQRGLTEGILASMQDGQTLQHAVELWEEEQAVLVKRWQRMLTELKNTDQLEFSMVSVALRELLDLAQSSRHQKSCD